MLENTTDTIDQHQLSIDIERLHDMPALRNSSHAHKQRNLKHILAATAIAAIVLALLSYTSRIGTNGTPGTPRASQTAKPVEAQPDYTAAVEALKEILREAKKHLPRSR
jgi:hypothetical protein